jgi:hypothetical protein
LEHRGHSLMKDMDGPQWPEHHLELDDLTPVVPFDDVTPLTSTPSTKPVPTH